MFALLLGRLFAFFAGRIAISLGWWVATHVAMAIGGFLLHVLIGRLL